MSVKRVVSAFSGGVLRCQYFAVSAHLSFAGDGRPGGGGENGVGSITTSQTLAFVLLTRPTRQRRGKLDKLRGNYKHDRFNFSTTGRMFDINTSLLPSSKRKKCLFRTLLVSSRLNSSEEKQHRRERNSPVKKKNQFGGQNEQKSIKI